MRKIILIILLFVFCPASQAAIIEIALIGQVDYVDDPYNLLENKVQQNDTITGFYIYDSETPNSSLQFNEGVYQHTTAPYGISLTIGSLTFQMNPANEEFWVTIWNKSHYDKYCVLSCNNLPLANGATVDGIGLSLDDLSGAAISSIELPLTPPDLSKWPYNDVSVGGGMYPFPPDEKTLFEIRGHIDSIWLIPEPTTLLLFGLGGLFLRKRK